MVKRGAHERPKLPKPRRMRRTWPQRLVVTFNSFLILAALAVSGLLAFGRSKAQDVTRYHMDVGVLGQTPTPITRPPTLRTDAAGETIPIRDDLVAKNFLIVGVDSRECIPKDSPYAGAFLGEGADIGERTDSIMLVRADPVNDQISILSFPRDLWVKISGRKSSSRINSAIEGGPDKLIQTIQQNFDIPVDHFIRVDFCMFMDVVNAIGGVPVAFKFAARDKHTGLNVTLDNGSPVCRTMGGEEALAYVRSRHYQYLDPRTNTWKDDPSSDFGRIARQQEFLRLIMKRAVAKGARNPTVLKRLLDAAVSKIGLDDQLSFREGLDLALKLRNIDPDVVQRYTIDAKGQVINGASVLIKRNNSYNAAVTKIFRGEALDQNASSTTTVPGATTVPDATVPATTTAIETTVPAATTVPGTTPTTATGGPTVIEVPSTLSNSVTPANDEYPACR